MLAEYQRCAAEMPVLAVEVLSRLADNIRVFNRLVSDNRSSSKGITIYLRSFK